MNVELVSKTMPEKPYFENKLSQLVKDGIISQDEKEESLKHLDAEEMIIYIARVSSSRDNKLEDYEGLLNYLIEHGHWSPFQMADMTVEIKTSRAIGRQLLRHRSFTFQEFSQRYSSDIEFETIELRESPDKNRQSSSDWIGEAKSTPAYIIDGQHLDTKLEGDVAYLSSLMNQIQSLYDDLIDAGVASETARMILPECTSTTLYMKGSIRSWLHYLQLRSKENTQKEHREVANEIGKIFQEEFPVTSNALDFNYDS